MKDVALIRYDAACKAIAAAKSVDEAKKIRDTAEAMRAYAKVAKNRELEIDAAEIRIRAERRVGELISAQKLTVGLAQGKRTDLGPERTQVDKPTLAEAGIDKKLASRGRKFARVPSPLFEAYIADWRERVWQETERVTVNLLREGERQQKRGTRVARPLPPGVFRLLYVDPPWQYEHVETESRAIENQYPTMTLEDICALQVPAADDAVLFLWATSPKLAEAIDVIKAWHFNYRTCAVWDKQTIGMGYYFRQQHELLLVAAKGELPVPKPSLRPSSLISSKRGKHSEKPTAVYELLEAMYPDFTEQERVELFARTPRRGWTQWGNEQAA